MYVYDENSDIDSAIFFACAHARILQLRGGAVGEALGAGAMAACGCIVTVVTDCVGAVDGGVATGAAADAADRDRHTVSIGNAACIVVSK